MDAVAAELSSGLGEDAAHFSPFGQSAVVAGAKTQASWLGRGGGWGRGNWRSSRSTTAAIASRSMIASCFASARVSVTERSLITSVKVTSGLPVVGSGGRETKCTTVPLGLGRVHVSVSTVQDSERSEEHT